MGRLSDMSDSFGRLAASVADGSILRDAFRGSPSVLDGMVELQGRQLDEGLNCHGQPMAPSYLEDPFFRSPETAAKYSERKARMRAERGVSRSGNPDAPDLFLTGFFRSGFYVRLGDADLQMQNDTLVPDRRGNMHDVYAKYGAGQFGLTDESWGEVLPEIVPAVKRLILASL